MPPWWRALEQNPIKRVSIFIVLGAGIVFMGFLMSWNAPPAFGIDGLTVLLALHPPYRDHDHVFQLLGVFLGALGIFILAGATLVLGFRLSEPTSTLRASVIQLILAFLGLVALPFLAFFLTYPSDPNAVGIGLYVMAVGFCMAILSGLIIRVGWKATKN